MIELADSASRERFTAELNQNFSVIASAGSGKTRAITDRVVQIAKSANARDWLPKLVVVTYTNRAADEMQQRTRQQILESGLPLEVVATFNHAFFGTIHSFCLKLLANHGHYLGLPPSLETITDDDDLWNEFVQRQTMIGRALSKENRAALLRLVQVRQLMELARRGNFDANLAAPANPCPDANFSEVYTAVARGSTLRTIPKSQEELRRWEQRWRETNDFVSLPICSSQAREFSQFWSEAFRPLRDWINSCAACAAAEVQRDYREFRLEHGALTYRDQIALALGLMRHPEAARRIREKNYRVILDEAQDTEPEQFSVLLEIARPPSAAEVWMEDYKNDPPRAGHFCMVGDFQQSIYRDRADLCRYRELHERLTETGAADELTFSVTFRLDRAQLDFVNQTFGAILNNLDGQVEFVELNPRSDVLPGQVIRLNLGADVDPTSSEEKRARIEAEQLARWLRAAGLKKLRADCWRQVAILSPRKAWLPTLRDALRDVGLAAQIQSESDRRGDNPAYAWLTALLTIMTEPRAGYEIVGVLRDIFGISDDTLARFSQGEGARFQIAGQTLGRGVVPETLNLLARTYIDIVLQPLFNATREIVRATQLRERLIALPVEDFGDQAADLDALLTSAAGAEASGMTLAEFVEDLRANFDATREVRASSDDAIQLITEHKAKGLEWQTVIVPFLSRQVRTGSSRYPRVIKSIQESEPQIAFAKNDLSPQLQSELRDSERQEMERLLYVALTRAKHSLVLALDRQLFASTKGDIHRDSQLKWLRSDIGEQNEPNFTALTEEPSECAETLLRQKESAVKIDMEKAGALPPLSAKLLRSAQERADNFVRKFNPSELPAEAEARVEASIEFERELRSPALANPAVRYGVWWHEFAQRISWNNSADSWETIFEKSRATSPDATRSAREWHLLRNHLASAEDFRRRFSEGQFLAHTEMPFFWRWDERRCLEGIVDLALFDRERKWLLVDWKTDRVASDKIDILRGRYRPQLAAYWQAVGEMTQMEVEAAIYSTSTGAFLLYKQEELRREWTRLKALPPDRLTEEVAGDQAETPVQLEFSALSNRARRG